MSGALSKGLQGAQWSWMTMDHDGTSWGRATSPLKSREMMVDRLPWEGVPSFHPIGLDRDRSKW